MLDSISTGGAANSPRFSPAAFYFVCREKRRYVRRPLLPHDTRAAGRATFFFAELYARVELIVALYRRELLA